MSAPALSILAGIAFSVFTVVHALIVQVRERDVTAKAARAAEREAVAKGWLADLSACRGRASSPEDL